MVAGYYDLLYRLLHRYYEDSLTPGLGDDLESLKRIIDHISCKIDEKKPSGCIKTADADKEINKIEHVFSIIQEKRQRGVNMHKTDYEMLSKAKKDLRLLHRKLMYACQRMGDFEKSRALRGKREAWKKAGFNPEDFEE